MEEEKISIIMGVYNCSNTIYEAIDSIINQTYKNWEFIICDDCSTDDTLEKIMYYSENHPNKFKIIKNERNSKLAYSLNHCLSYATGEYIARMDADDISHKDRLKKQVDFLKANHKINLVGTSIQRFNEQEFNDVVNTIEKPDKFSLRNGPPFVHATIVTYKNVYDTLGGYTVSKKTIRSQDLELWFRFFKAGFIGRNITEALYYVREDQNAIRRRTFKVRYNGYKITVEGYRLLGFPLYWYIPLTASFIMKALTPYFVVDIYRKYQSMRRNKE